MLKILVLCTGNSCRSQMAEGFLKAQGEDAVSVSSAGLEAHGLNPRAVQVMQEAGIDISGHTSEILDIYQDRPFDLILTVCDHAAEHCPYIPGKAIRLHRSFPDPAKASGSEEEILESFRQTRDQIEAWCREVLAKYG